MIEQRIEAARELVEQAQHEAPSRELSLVATKLDEARLWAAEARRRTALADAERKVDQRHEAMREHGSRPQR